MLQDLSPILQFKSSFISKKWRNPFSEKKDTKDVFLILFNLCI